MKSECFICGNPDTERHHVFFGSKNRQISEKHGFVVDLCYIHHRGTYGVHGKYGHQLDLQLKQHCQREFEKTHTREEFIKLIGRNYLD